ncbi:hypothetical protein BJX70DRAFT_115077 [Aspergillus crustosus]
MAPLTSREQAWRLMLCAVGVVIIISLIFWSPLTLSKATEPDPESQHVVNHFESIRNVTLGVQKVFAINLPSRRDKRDNIVLGSSLTEFHVDFIDGVTPDQINPKTYPYNWNYDHRPVEYAARRAHLDVMQRVVSEGLGSAIIMEDDADWDITIKTQLQSFAIAVGALQGVGDKVTDSPYGDDWDILWLGHCGLECRNDVPSFLTPNDSTVPPPHHFLPYWRDPPLMNRPDDSRLACLISDGVCSIVYAISFRGAQRILAALSVNPSGIAETVDIGAQFDVSLGRLCGSGFLRCFAPYPSLTGGYIPRGAVSKGSDINGLDGNLDKPFEGAIEGPFSNGVMYSTMLNINRILNGMATVLSTWDDAPIREFRPGDEQVLYGVLQKPKEEV